MRKLTRNEMFSSATASRRVSMALTEKLRTPVSVSKVEHQNLIGFKKAASSEVSTRERLFARNEPLE